MSVKEEQCVYRLVHEENQWINIGWKNLPTRMGIYPNPSNQITFLGNLFIEGGVN